MSTDLPLSPRTGIVQTSALVDPGADRIWIGNDASLRNHNAVLDLDRSRFSLALGWRERRDSPIHPVGTFDIDLHKLLDADLIRLEREGAVRMRFIHLRDGHIALQRRLNAPRVLLRRLEWPGN